MDLEIVLRGELLDQASHFSVADDGESFHSKEAGSGFVKNSRWRDSTARRTSVAATTTLRLSRDAPWEIMRTLRSLSAEKTREETPGVWRMLSPTMQTMAWLSSTETSLNDSSSVRMAGSDAVLSMVSETLTSDVA